MSPALWLGLATVEDSPALAALEAACHTHPWTEPQFREEVSYGPPGAVLVLRAVPAPSEEWRGIRAYCVYRLVVDEMHILNVAVAPDRRRQGLARWLLGFALGQATRAGVRRALLEVRQSNHEALLLYRALGFARVGMRRDYYSVPREDAVVFGLDLPPDPLP